MKNTDQTHYIIREVRVPLEKPHTSILERVRQFRMGQQDRKAGQPCKSTDGAYLDGWYSPEKGVPPYVTTEEARCFNL